jgi:DNA repair protein RadA/Sms
MAKTKTTYVCQNCGAESAKWVGKCFSCGEWNTYVEEVVIKQKATKSSSGSSAGYAKAYTLLDIPEQSIARIDSTSNETNRVLGGGFVPGSLVLIGGEPGIGKSTLALQIVLQMHNKKCFYVSGEESLQQLKMRAERLKLSNKSCMFLAASDIDVVMQHAKNQKPDLLVIDSIQTMADANIESVAGSVSQVRNCTGHLQRMAKEENITIILIGHINKEGNLAGPKVLEHIVDTVLQFEGDQQHLYRILRTLKNRFGSTSELGIFEMRNVGLVEVSNPSELLVSANEENLSGVTVAATIDGVRPFLIEIQALVSSAVYGNPQRSATGFDVKRLNMLLAVLEKRAGFHLAAKDVFLNIAGGLKVNDPAIDMAVISSVLSSTADIAIEKGNCFAGEIGLTGEVRPVNKIEQRILEAEKLGYKNIFISKYNKKVLDLHKLKINLIQVGKIEEIFKKLFG